MEPNKKDDPDHNFLHPENKSNQSAVNLSESQNQASTGSRNGTTEANSPSKSPQGFNRINGPKLDLHKHQKDKNKMTIKERLLMGPIEKYKKYGIFPWKIIIQLALMFMTATEVMIVVQPETNFQANISEFLLNQFMTIDPTQRLPPREGQTFMITSILLLDSFMQQIVGNYYTLNSTQNLENFQPAMDQYGTIQGIQLFIYPDNAELFDSGLFYELTPGDLGPFQLPIADQKTYLNKISRFTLAYSIKQSLQFVNPLISNNCYLWNFSQNFDFKKRGSIEVSLFIDRYSCQVNTKVVKENGARKLWIFSLAILLCIIDNVRIARHLVKTFQFVAEMKERFDRKIQEAKLRHNTESETNTVESQNSTAKRDKRYDNIERKNSKFITRSQSITTGGQRSNSANPRTVSQAERLLRNEEIQDTPAFPREQNTPAFPREQNNLDDQGMFQHLEETDSQGSNNSDRTSQRSTISRESSLSLLSLDSIQDRQDLAPHQINMLMEKAILTGNLNWENLSFKDKAQLFDGWSFIGFGGNLLLIFGNVFYLASDFVPFFQAELLIGLGTFSVWIRAVKFLEGQHPFDLMVKTLGIAGPTMTKVAIGVLPFIIGSALLAQMLFWKSHEFFGFYFKTQWYVFALMTGDGIYAVFSMLVRNTYLIGYIFGFIYTFLVISTVMSIFMVIVEDAYVTAKYSQKYSWLVELEEMQKRQDDEDQSPLRNNLQPGVVSVSGSRSENELAKNTIVNSNTDLRLSESKFDFSRITRQEFSKQILNDVLNASPQQKKVVQAVKDPSGIKRSQTMQLEDRRRSASANDLIQVGFTKNIYQLDESIKEESDEILSNPSIGQPQLEQPNDVVRNLVLLQQQKGDKNLDSNYENMLALFKDSAGNEQQKDQAAQCAKKIIEQYQKQIDQLAALNQKLFSK